MIFAKANNILDKNIRTLTTYLGNFAPEQGRGAKIVIRVSY